MTCPNCERLWRRVEELEHQNAELKTENAQLKSRLAAYENAHTAPSQRKFPIRRCHNYVLATWKQQELDPSKMLANNLSLNWQNS